MKRRIIFLMVFVLTLTITSVSASDKTLRVISQSGIGDPMSQWNISLILLNTKDADVLLTNELFASTEANVTCNNINRDCQLVGQNDIEPFIQLAIDTETNILLAVQYITINNNRHYSGLLFINKEGSIEFVDYLGQLVIDEPPWNPPVDILENKYSQQFKFASPICAKGFTAADTLSGEELDIMFHPRASSGFLCLDDMQLVQEDNYDLLLSGYHPIYTQREYLVDTDVLSENGLYVLAEAPPSDTSKDLACTLTSKTNSPLNFLEINLDTNGGYIYFETNFSYELLNPPTSTIFVDEYGNPITKADPGDEIYLRKNDFNFVKLTVEGDINLSSVIADTDGTNSLLHFGSASREGIGIVELIATRDGNIVSICIGGTSLNTECLGDVILLVDDVNENEGGYMLVNTDDPNYWHIQADVTTISTWGSNGDFSEGGIPGEPEEPEIPEFSNIGQIVAIVLLAIAGLLYLHVKKKE